MNSSWHQMQKICVEDRSRGTPGQSPGQRAGTRRGAWEEQRCLSKSVWLDQVGGYLHHLVSDSTPDAGSAGSEWKYTASKIPLGHDGPYPEDLELRLEALEMLPNAHVDFPSWNP